MQQDGQVSSREDEGAEDIAQALAIAFDGSGFALLPLSADDFVEKELQRSGGVGEPGVAVR
jgi:hypothetical protein